MVECKICGNEYVRLSGHIQVHDMDIEDYKEKFPAASTNDEEAVEKIRESTERRHRENPEYTEYSTSRMVEERNQEKINKLNSERMKRNNPMKRDKVVQKMMESIDIEEKTRVIKEWRENNPNPVKGRERSEEWKQMMSEKMRGRSLSKKTRRKIAETKREKGDYEEARERMKEKNPMSNPEISEKISGENHYRWKGGASKNKYGSGWTPQKREEVRERDNKSCVFCGMPNAAHQLLHKSSGSLPVHHLDGNKENNSKGNLIAVCYICHSRLHNSKHLRPECLS